MTGVLNDKTSSSFTTMISNIFIVFSLIFGFIFPVAILPVLIIFPMFMIGMSIRNVSSYTLFSKVPSLSERAGFMSMISCVQHLACSAGSVLASAILVNQPSAKLENINIVVIISILAFLVVPYLFKIIENYIKIGSATYFPRDNIY